MVALCGSQQGAALAVRLLGGLHVRHRIVQKLLLCLERDLPLQRHKQQPVNQACFQLERTGTPELSGKVVPVRSQPATCAGASSLQRQREQQRADGG